MSGNTTPLQRGNATGANDGDNRNIRRPCDTRQSDDAFRAAMAEAGLVTSDPILADGGLHRVHLEGDRRGSRNGWYVLHADPPVAGAFGSWRHGVSGTWSATEHSRLSTVELAEIRRRREAARAARMLETDRAQRQAATRAAALWKAATPADAQHPYLLRKHVTPGIARQSRDRLVLPVLDLAGALWSLQFIDPEGGKMLLSGGRKRGNVIPVAGRMPGAARVLICEGWATGRTLAEMEPDALVLAAVDAGNLQPVAVAARKRWQRAEIVICCDRDPVGRQKGWGAAIAAGASVAIPEFPAGAEGSDFNDLAAVLREVAG